MTKKPKAGATLLLALVSLAWAPPMALGGSVPALTPPGLAAMANLKEGSTAVLSALMFNQ